MAGSTVVVLAVIGVIGLRRRVSARLRLALSYAAFLVVAGGVALLGVYIVLRYVPDYPGMVASPENADLRVVSRQEILEAVVGVSGTILVGLGGDRRQWRLDPRGLGPCGHCGASTRPPAWPLTGISAIAFVSPAATTSSASLPTRSITWLDRLDGAFASQERFAANASHELRTPAHGDHDPARCRPAATPAGQDYPTLIDRLSPHQRPRHRADRGVVAAGGCQRHHGGLEPGRPSRGSWAMRWRSTPRKPRRSVSTLDVQLRPAPTVGDPYLLAQLTSNLIQNAIRHNVVDAGTARIATGPDRSGARVLLRVENTGAVYTAEVVAQLSEPFLRGGGRVNRAGQATRGYGLGLALVSRITEVHAGDLTIAPRAGGGLIVTLTLPAAPSHPD